ncbi:50S ribosomal protein L22 [archaeon]|nr:50S ribosomal protein L22 [archaeon]|tara:strand:+ start:278 stop:733 length:456 start_codon:yes stop_codon:yes gene_type:complete
MVKKEHTASVMGNNVDISKKHSIEIGDFIRGKNIDKAKALMEGVIAKKIAVPFKRFNMDVGHKKGRIAAGRYPVKAAQRILGLLNSAESNAEDKGLDLDVLYVSEFIANKGTGSLHQSRHRGRSMKRTHIKIVLEEREKKVAKKAKEEIKK